MKRIGAEVGRQRNLVIEVDLDLGMGSGKPYWYLGKGVTHNNPINLYAAALSRF